MSQSLAETRPTGTMGGLFRSPGAIVLLLGIGCALLLALPGVTVTTRSIDELFLLFDGIHRVLEGQIPNRDFTTSLGPLAFYLPAMIAGITGNYGAALPTAMALVLCLMAVAARHVLLTRLHPYLALPFAAFLFLILAAPMNLGEPIAALSFAMFYNRIGWAAIALLLVLYLKPRSGDPVIRSDAAVAAALTLILLYLRATYGFAALVFLLFMLTDARQWRWAGTALVVVLGTVVFLALLWPGSSSYWTQAWDGVNVAGASLFGIDRFTQPALGHLADLLLLGLLVSFCLWRNWSWRDAAFFLLCVLGGLWLLSYNVQRWGVISIHAAAVVAAELLFRRMEPDKEDGATLVNRYGVALYSLAFVLPTIVHCGMALSLHVGAAVLRAGEPVDLGRVNGIYVADLWPGGDQRGSLNYLDAARDGLSMLRKADTSSGGLAVLGSVDVFSPALGLEPAVAVPLDMRWPSLISSGATSPGGILGRIDTVVVRRSGELSSGLPAAYMRYIDKNFSQIAQTDLWSLHRRASVGPAM
ncbi:MAG TPA: hypothetical protein VHG11_00630 [Pseudorhizobium sp.]|nr:hypothetical protein [Pseudorhizobium sp.]